MAGIPKRSFTSDRKERLTLEAQTTRCNTFSLFGMVHILGVVWAIRAFWWWMWISFDE